MNLRAVQIRDPFVLSCADTNTYHLFGTTDKAPWKGPGTGFDCYRSRDLQDWEGPFPAFRPPPGFWGTTQFWAPEVHAHGGRFFMFATFNADVGYRGTQVLAADRPEGPYAPWSDGPVTPPHWQCLDGTLHTDAADTPWLVFCHEWAQIHNGSICAQRLSPDLRRAEGRPVFLFDATDAPWVRCLGEGHGADATVGAARPWKFPDYVTDGPFLHRTGSGTLLMLWSSFGGDGYAMGVARSATGEVTGPWLQEAEPLWARDGGHGMIFRAFDGRLFLTIHTPNVTPHERAIFHELVEDEQTVRLKTA